MKVKEWYQKDDRMDNREVREWGREAAKGRRSFLWSVILMAFLPALIFGGVNYILGLWGYYLYPVTEFVLDWIVGIFGFGLYFVMLEMAQGREVRFDQVFTPLTRPWLKKVILMALFLTLVSTLVNLYPDYLTQKGEALKAQAEAAMAANRDTWDEFLGLYAEGLDLAEKGRNLGTLFSFLLIPLLLPLHYLIFLRPNDPITSVIKEGLSRGLEYWLWTVGFFIVSFFFLWLSIILWLFLLQDVPAIAFLMIICNLIYWLPQYQLTMARYALDMC